MEQFINSVKILSVGNWNATDEKTGKLAHCPLEGAGLRDRGYQGYSRYDSLAGKVAAGQVNPKVFHVIDDLPGQAQ